MKKTYFILLFVVIVGALLIVFQRPLRISYHRFMKDYCEKKALSLPPLHDNKTKYFKDSNSHLQSLWRLGYYEKKCFELVHVKKPSLDAKRLEHILINLHIHKDHIITFPINDEKDHFEISIYAPPKYISQYEMIIHAFDSTTFQSD
jgi:hypothetical protein